MPGVKRKPPRKIADLTMKELAPHFVMDAERSLARRVSRSSPAVRKTVSDSSVRESEIDDRRIEHVARRCARIVLELRAQGDRDGAARLEAAAIETVERIKRGAL